MNSPALRDVLWAVTLKVVLLGVLYLGFVKPIEPPRADDYSTAAAIAGTEGRPTRGAPGQDAR